MCEKLDSWKCGYAAACTGTSGASVRAIRDHKRNGHKANDGQAGPTDGILYEPDLAIRGAYTQETALRRQDERRRT